VSPAAPPPRPPFWQERAAGFFLRTFSPSLPRIEQPPPPPELGPCERFEIPRPERGGRLGATWYPAPAARGAVLLAPPWVEWGQAYFHRRGRIEALRAAGYHVMTFDLSGFGASGPRAGLFDRDVADALAALRERAGGLPLHLWGVSSGGYWSQMLLSRTDGVLGAVFEDVSPHLVEWAANTAPWGWPAFAAFPRVVPDADAFLNLRRHAPFLQVRAAAYVGGEMDRGAPAVHTRELARLAGAECLIVPGAPHLGAIKQAGEEVVALALRTFERAERG
jgi:hypothetical protein